MGMVVASTCPLSSSSCPLTNLVISICEFQANVFIAFLSFSYHFLLEFWVRPMSPESLAVDH